MQASGYWRHSGVSKPVRLNFPEAGIHGRQLALLGIPVDRDRSFRFIAAMRVRVFLPC